MSVLQELNRPDGIIPVTPDAVAELVGELRKIRERNLVLEEAHRQTQATLSQQHEEIERLRAANGQEAASEEKK